MNNPPIALPVKIAAAVAALALIGGIAWYYASEKPHPPHATTAPATAKP